MSARAGRPTVSVLMLCAACAASAEAPPDVLAPILACRDLAEAEARLACFDRESSALSKSGRDATAASTPPTPPVAPAAPAASAIMSPEDAFGLPPMDVVKKENAATQRKELTESAARLAGLHYLTDGRIEFIFENGQVWRQLSVSEDLLLKTGDVVKISMRALRSYWLKAPSGRGCKVTRIR